MRSLDQGSLETVVQNIGITLMIQGSHQNGRIAVGNKIGRGLVARRLGGSTLVGMSSCSSTRSTLLIRKCRRQKNGWAKSQLTSSMVTQQKNIDLEEPTPLTDQVCLGSAQRESVTKQSNVKIKSEFIC